MPRICLLIYTYNRAKKVIKAIESVLNQTYRDFELVLINNGSTDNTKEVLENYRLRENVRIIHLEKNLGSLGGMNYALDQISGEWYGVLGDDDHLYSNAFEEMMQVVDKIDPTINAVSANGIATATGKFSGLGLNRDQYLSVETIINQTSGDFFALTKKELLGDLRLNEKLSGQATTLWNRIDAKANRYYIHKALMEYNNISGETETSRLRKLDIEAKIMHYEELLKETEYLEIIRTHNIEQYRAICLRGLFFMKISRDTACQKQYKEMFGNAQPNNKERLLAKSVSLTPNSLLTQLYRVAGSNRSVTSTFSILAKKYS